MTNEGPGRVLTPTKLSDRWQSSERHVHNMSNRGELPVFKLGGKRIRIKISDVENSKQNVGSAEKS